MSAAMSVIESSGELFQFRTKDGSTSIEPSQIICLRAQINYLMFQLADGERVVK